MTVAKTNAELTGKATPPSIELVAASMAGVGTVVRVKGFGEDPSCRRRETAETTKKPPRAARVAEQAKVVPEHDKGVEVAELVTHPSDREDARIAYPPESTCPDSEG